MMQRFIISLQGFALGIEGKILFALLQSKKIGTKSPLERPMPLSYGLCGAPRLVSFNFLTN